MHKLFSCLLLLLSNQGFSQTEKTFRITSSFTSFPDTARVNGHHYNNVWYATAEHYSDSTVMIIVPPNLKTKKQVDLVFWFHGWRNNIDSAAVYFELVKQFLASHRDAILILPETTKDAPDSYGGKLEQKDIFKNLLNDVLDKLKKEKAIDKRAGAGNVVLAGHSGAFRVMAHILQHGGVEVKQTILFDALYSQVDKFTNWIQADSSHLFINIYTDKGGTDEVSRKMMQLLRNKNIAFINLEEIELNVSKLRKNKIIFIHSLKEHNDVINRPDHNFRLYLENSPVLKPVF
jgi:methylmalonyl-CoA mutase cobalamin-binding subunit